MKKVNMQIMTMLLMINTMLMGIVLTDAPVEVEAKTLVKVEWKSPIEKFDALLELAIHERNEAIRIAEEAAIAEVIRLEEEAIAAAAQAVNLQYSSEWFDVFTPSNLSEDDLYKSLGVSRSGLYDIVPAVVAAEDIYGVNAVYLLATIGYESGWGKYESGWNNVAGWKPNGQWGNYESRYDCIMAVADGLYHSFLPDVGRTLGGVTWRYCKDPGYTSTIITIINELQNNIY